MVILRIHGKGTDNFSLLAMLLIYAYVPLIFLLPPSSSPGFVMIFFSIDELSGSTVLSLIMCLNLMHHTNYLAQQPGYTCCLLFDVAAPADFLNIDRNHTFSLSFVCLINYCHQCACLETTPKGSQATTARDRKESSRQVPERNFQLGFKETVRSVLRCQETEAEKQAKHRFVWKAQDPGPSNEASLLCQATHASSSFFSPE